MRFIKNEPFPFQFAVFEIHNHADWNAGDTKIIQQCPAMVNNNRFNGFCIHNHTLFDDEIRHKFINLLVALVNRKLSLLAIFDSLVPKFYAPRVFISFLP